MSENVSNDELINFAQNIIKMPPSERAEFLSSLDDNSDDEKIKKLRELKKIFFDDCKNGSFFIKNKNFLDEKFLSKLVDIKFKDSDYVSKINLDAFINAMVCNFFVKENKRTLSGDDITSLYNSVMGLVEDKFYELTAIKISTEIYGYFFSNTINRSIEQTILLNPFFPIILSEFIKFGGFKNKDEYDRNAVKLENDRKFNRVDYSNLAQTPLSKIQADTDYKAVSYAKEKEIISDENPDTLFFNTILKDTKFDNLHNFKKQPNLFKLSDYVISSQNDDDYIKYALGSVKKSLYTPLLPSQQSSELVKMQEQIKQDKEREKLDDKEKSLFSKLKAKFNEIKKYLDKG